MTGWRKKQIMEPNKKTLKPKAFPNAFWRDSDGMDLRDYFASDAMKGLLSDPDWRHNMNYEETAHAAYTMADAMLKAREA